MKNITLLLKSILITSISLLCLTACQSGGEARLFRIFTYGDYAVSYEPEELTGNSVNDAVYLRNKNVEEELNVIIEAIDSGSSGYKSHSEIVKTNVFAGDDSFEISLEHAVNGPSNSLEGIFVNLYDIPSIDLSRSWWTRGAVDELSFKGKLYMGSGALHPYGAGTTKVIAFNSAENDSDMLYDSVLNGNWTLDSLISLTRNVYRDVNGNGERDFEDYYGYVSYSAQNMWLSACEILIITKTDNSLELTVFNEKTVKLIDKLYNWYFETAGGNVLTKSKDELTGYSRTEWQTKLFDENHALFACADLNTASAVFRNGNIQYGILPIPKFDEAQENYRSFSSELFFAVPITCSDLEFTGEVLSAMSKSGYESVLPVFYKTILKNENTAANKVLNLIYDSRIISFSYVFDNWEGFGHLLSELFGDPPNHDFASFYAERFDSAQARLNKIIGFYTAD